jgi:glycosyltransferase involved in cell wall biosynthesis
MNDAPRVSVVIPVYNRQAYIGAAVDSVLAQTFADFEVLVIDDGSTDQSRDVVRTYRDPRVHLVCHERNQGIPRTRNTGIDAAHGTYLAFLDSDDIALPTRLAKQVAFLDRHPHHAAVGGWIDWMDHTGRPLRRVKRRPLAASDVAALRLFRQGIENTASMARTAILRAYRHDERFDVSEDFEIWARIAAKHEIANLPEVLVRRRAHGQQTSRGKDERTRRYRQAIYADQLRALGIAFTETDLERHHLLRRMRKARYTPDREYVDWAEAWLLGLRAANARISNYPEPSFSQLLGALWFKVCWNASRAVGWPTVWRRCWASPLRRRALPGLRKELFLNGPRPVAWLAGVRFVANARRFALQAET